MTSPNQITSLLLAGYRSFGNKIQRFENFSKVNLLIGPNNSGKSNVLRFLHEIYPQVSAQNRAPLALTPLDRHFPNHAEFRFGFRFPIAMDSPDVQSQLGQWVTPRVRSQVQPVRLVPLLLRVFKRKAELDQTRDRETTFGSSSITRTSWYRAIGMEP